MTKKEKKTLTMLSQAEYSKLMKFLQDAEVVKHKEFWRLYIVSLEQMKKIVAMKKRFGKKLQEAGITPPRNDPYYFVAKLINPNPKDCALEYTIVEIKRYILVRDKEAILKNIDKDFEIWKNIQKKLAKEACENNNDAEFCKKIQKETEKKIESAYEEKEMLKRDFDSYDVVRTSYEHAKTYPSVNFKRKDKDYYAEHLRKGIPNILQVCEANEDKDRRKDNEIELFIKEAKHPFRYIYYKKKDA